MNPGPADTTPKSREGFWGTGLSPVVLAVILATATAFFLFWGRPLWSVPPGSSHVARIAYSYLLVLPMVATALLATRRWSWAHLFGGVAVIWGAKLLITATVYGYLATGSASQYSPSKPWEASPAERQRPARGVHGRVSGAVLRGGSPLAGAIVVAQGATGPGGEGRRVTLTIHGSRYDAPLYLAAPEDSLAVVNQDGSLHNVRAHSGGRTAWNIPIPAGAEAHALPAAKPGVYQLSCDSHPIERATLIIAPRGAAAVTDAGGRFLLTQVPAGAADLEVIAPGLPPVRRDVAIEPGHEAHLTIELSPTEERRP